MDTYNAHALSEPLLDTRGAAALLHLSPRTLEGWRADPRKQPEHGAPPHLRLSRGAIRYRPSDIQAWLDRVAVA
ncbi:helix-turn-helix domain-containing protein [Demequina capsici]|uniref:Helix-turn-helix domain-containing protein n=1 Tax=Demequina capsici TaxID=3075620 RepID=A0AA96FC03_9MICO|nr:helix-turn-helix domain-containing protein [Demequina sp. PMTSA13]WNM27363.1 helix-turn-helix domain-containing protein [Demequina sp. PMTSA13]